MSRYIDKDKLLNRLCGNDISRIEDYYYNAILDEPEADVVAVKHGKWLKTNDDNKLRCSECDVIHLIAQYPNGEVNYCPNCGTRMDGDD